MTLLSAASHIWNYHNGNFTPTTIVWTLTGIIGSIFAGFNLRDAVLDLEALAETSSAHTRHDDLLMFAKAAIRQDAVRLAQMLAVVTIGVVVSVTTPVLNDQQRKLLHIPYWTPTGIALTAVLLFIVVAIAIQAYLDRRLRRRFYGSR